MTCQELYNHLENGNHHGLTALLCALMAENYDAVIRLSDIIKAHQREGSMTGAMSALRYEISQPLYEALVKEGKL